MIIRALTLLIFLFARPALAAIELKSSFLPSLAFVGRNDMVFSSHNTLLFGGGGFLVGGYASYETISTNVLDQSYGAAIRIGSAIFVEVQGGIFTRTFTQQSIKLEGKGVSGNLVVGAHVTNNFGLSLFLSGKKIDSGMDKRTIVDLLPFLSLRFEL